MPEMTGAQLAGHARRVRPETVRILLTGQRSLETAIDGINQGEIFRFLNKPFDNEQLRGAVLAGVARNRELLAMSGDRRAPRAPRAAARRARGRVSRASPRSRRAAATPSTWSPKIRGRRRRRSGLVGARHAPRERHVKPDALDHSGEDGAPCATHPAAELDRILALASLGARASGFNHDLASKLQGVMMALDELDEALERRPIRLLGGRSTPRRARCRSSTSCSRGTARWPAAASAAGAPCAICCSKPRVAAA